ncbi:MAG: branched-chain amino acid aminotransferase [Verrucomicrobiales bacterium]|jgi:branched-chain amino acid aminotransferase
MLWIFSVIREISPGFLMSEHNSNSTIVWLNGAIKSADSARISPFDHGLLTGDGVFETLKSYRGRPFELERHHARMRRGGELLGLEVPSLDELKTAIGEVLSANKIEKADCRIRITVTGGVAPLGSDKGDSGPTTLIAISGLPAHPAEGQAITVPYCRNELGALAGFKTTSYGENVVALAAAKKADAHEAIFPNTKGNLCEGTGSNIFVVYGGQLITPPLSSGCLAGVTRAVVIEICEKAGISVAEIDTPIQQLLEADEIFLTGTLREVMPVSRVDEIDFACPGPISERIRAAFQRHVADFAG